VVTRQAISQLKYNTSNARYTKKKWQETAIAKRCNEIHFKEVIKEKTL
jgi:hypothetical protein